MENSVITDQNAIFSKKWKSNKKVEKSCIFIGVCSFTRKMEGAASRA